MYVVQASLSLQKLLDRKKNTLKSMNQPPDVLHCFSEAGEGLGLREETGDTLPALKAP